MWVTPRCWIEISPKTHERGESNVREGRDTHSGGYLVATSRAAIAASMTNNREKSNAAEFD